MLRIKNNEEKKSYIGFGIVQFIPESNGTHMILIIVVWLFATADAYISVKKYNSKLEK
ncbi:MAG: hypothetical protein AB1349_14120 [Elusimicrobiota bacterium]